MANKYYYTACLKKGDNGGVAKDKRNNYNDAVEDLIELQNCNKTLGNNISFIGIVKHKASESPFDRIRDLNENLTLDVYTRIVDAMDELRKKIVLLCKRNDRDISEDYMCCKKVRYNDIITFDIEAYYSKDTFSLFEFQIYLKRKGRYKDCCTLPYYFKEEQEKDLREFINMYID